MKDTRLEYKDSWRDAARDWVFVMGIPPSPGAALVVRAARARMYFITVAFMANLTQSRGMNQMIFYNAIKPTEVELL
jgi:hypothetical protein